MEDTQDDVYLSEYIIESREADWKSLICAKS